MELVPVVSREAYLASIVYDLARIPYSPVALTPHVFYATCLGPFLRLAYRIEKNSLWNRLFTALVGVSGAQDEEVKGVLDELKAVDVYGWEEVKPLLEDVGRRVSRLYQDRRERIIGSVEKVFGFSRFFKRVYVVYGFNPLPRMTLGTMLHWDDANTIVAVYVNELQGENQVLDVVVHELLHGLLRLNNVELEQDLEELVVDVSAPGGYLSKMIGLVDRVNVRLESIPYFSHREPERYGRVFEALVEYYEGKVYEKTTIIEWVRSRGLST